MKILCLCNLVPVKYGAFERLLSALAQECRGHGDEMILGVAGAPAGMVAGNWRAAGLEWRLMSGWTDDRGREHPWRFVRPALRLARELKPDVVVLNFGNELPAFITSALTGIACRSRPRWIWQQHQQMADPVGLARLVSRISLLRLTFTHFATQYEGGRLSLAKRGIPLAATTAILNGVPEPARIRKPGWLRRELTIEDETPVALTVGSLIRRKRIEFQLEALADIVKECKVKGEKYKERENPSLNLAPCTFHSPHLIIVGEGPERAKLDKLVRDLGVANRVHFLGLRNDVADILLETDLYLHSSVAETCTYAIAEAMAAGIPAIATDAGAAREQIEDGKSGYVVARNDSDSFKARLLELLRDPDKRIAMGQAARERWKRHFVLENTVKQYCELYRSLVA